MNKAAAIRGCLFLVMSKLSLNKIICDYFGGHNNYYYLCIGKLIVKTDIIYQYIMNSFIYALMNGTFALSQDIIQMLTIVDNFQYEKFKTISNGKLQSLGDLHATIKVEVVDDLGSEIFQVTTTLGSVRRRLDILNELNREIDEYNKELSKHYQGNLLEDLCKRGYNTTALEDIVKSNANQRDGHQITFDVESEKLGEYTRFTNNNHQTQGLVRLKNTSRLRSIVSTYIHEMMHAFYDFPSLQTPMNTVPYAEESLAEYGVLDFLDCFTKEYPQYNDLFIYAYRSIASKLGSWGLKHYGFALCLFKDYRNHDWIKWMFEAHTLDGNLNKDYNKLVRLYSNDWQKNNQRKTLENDTARQLYIVLHNGQAPGRQFANHNVRQDNANENQPNNNDKCVLDVTIENHVLANPNENEDIKNNPNNVFIEVCDTPDFNDIDNRAWTTIVEVCLSRNEYYKIFDLHNNQYNPKSIDDFFKRYIIANTTLDTEFRLLISKINQGNIVIEIQLRLFVNNHIESLSIDKTVKYIRVIEEVNNIILTEAITLELSNIVVTPNHHRYYLDDVHNVLFDKLDNIVVIGNNNSIIPNSAISIGDYAFTGCDNLKNLLIPNNLEYLGKNVFMGCSQLESIDVSNQLINIPSHTFDGCSSLTYITIPDNVENIGDYAFKDCKRLNTINLPIGLEKIPNHAFEDCCSLVSITVPKSVVKIGDHAFKGCSNLRYFNLSHNNEIQRIEDSAFEGCFSLTSMLSLHAIQSIGKCIFKGCSNLATTILSEQVNEIPESAFEDCCSLTNLSNYHSLTKIGKCAFKGCSKLERIDIDNQIIEFPSYAFAGCKTLSEIRIPDSVEIIGDHVFEDCFSLSSIIIPDQVTEIKQYTFKGCCLLNRITLPNGISSIGEGVFQECSQLTTISLPDSINEIQKNAFKGCLSLEKIDIPNANAVFYDYAFKDCSKLKEITIPGRMTTIPKHAFEGCVSLTNIIFPDYLQKIDDYAFYNCCSINSIIVPNSVVYIGLYSFADCTNLSKVKILSTTAILATASFRGCPNLTEFVSPPELEFNPKYVFS